MCLEKRYTVTDFEKLPSPHRQKMSSESERSGLTQEETLAMAERTLLSLDELLERRRSHVENVENLNHSGLPPDSSVSAAGPWPSTFHSWSPIVGAQRYDGKGEEDSSSIGNRLHYGTNAVEEVSFTSSRKAARHRDQLVSKTKQAELELEKLRAVAAMRRQLQGEAGPQSLGVDSEALMVDDADFSDSFCTTETAPGTPQMPASFVQSSPRAETELAALPLRQRLLDSVGDSSFSPGGVSRAVEKEHYRVEAVPTFSCDALEDIREEGEAAATPDSLLEDDSQLSQHSSSSSSAGVNTNLPSVAMPEPAAAAPESEIGVSVLRTGSAPDETNVTSAEAVSPRGDVEQSAGRTGAGTVELASARAPMTVDSVHVTMVETPARPAEAAGVGEDWQTLLRQRFSDHSDRRNVDRRLSQSPSRAWGQQQPAMDASGKDLLTTGSEDNHAEGHMNSSQMRGSPQLDQIPSFSSASRREATLEEITGFANYLGMDMETDKHLLWIAEAAVLSPVPQGWTQHETEDGYSYFHSLDTGETSWEHPTDAHFKDLFRRVKEQEHNSVKAAEIAVMSLLGSDSSVVPGETERRGPQGRALLHAVRTAVADAGRAEAHMSLPTSLSQTQVALGTAPGGIQTVGGYRDEDFGRSKSDNARLGREHPLVPPHREAAGAAKPVALPSTDALVDSAAVAPHSFVEQVAVAELLHLHKEVAALQDQVHRNQSRPFCACCCVS